MRPSARKFIHKSLANGRWFKFSFDEQMGNIGSEVGRSAKWINQDEQMFLGAVSRGLELFNLTIEDPRWKDDRRREVAKARKIFCDAVSKKDKSSLEDLDRYFYSFAYAARNKL